jgi:serine/threonine protein kinase
MNSSAGETFIEKAPSQSGSVPPGSSPDGVAATPAEGIPQHPDYEMIRELARGGMGVVYLARNRQMDRIEVLKLVHNSFLDRAGARERFAREMRSAAKLNHPNIVTAYSSPRFGDMLAFAMEYVDGKDLGEVVKTRGTLQIANACFYAYHVALGLQHAHERGMVHRDIKPGNLILTRDGKRQLVKILDFGLAKASSEKVGDDNGLTRDGQMLGTPHYVAPEQTLDAKSADIRADIYSLGCTLYHWIAGAPPFQGGSLYELLRAHHSTEARPLHQVRPEVPVELSLVVSKMMAKDPNMRYQTPSEVAQVLVPFFKSPAKSVAESQAMSAASAAPLGAAIAPAAAVVPAKGQIQPGSIAEFSDVIDPSRSGPAGGTKKWIWWLAGDEKPDHLVRNIAIIGGIAVAIFAAVMLIPVLTEDTWALYNSERVSAKIDDAERLKKTDPLAAYKMLDELLNEAKQHKITDEQFSKKLNDADLLRSALYSQVQARITAEESEKKRKQDAEAKRIADEKQRVIDEENRARVAEETRLENEKRNKQILARYANLPQTARDALNAVKKLAAKTETGVIYADYTRAVGDTWGDVKIFVESAEGKKLPELSLMLRKAMDDYKSAGEAWSEKFDVHSDSTSQLIAKYELDDLMQRCWKRARERMNLAEGLLDSSTTEASVQAILSPAPKEEDFSDSLLKIVAKRK